MKLTPQQALQRILATKGTGAFRVAKKPPTLSKTLRNKLYVFNVSKEVNVILGKEKL